MRFLFFFVFIISINIQAQWKPKGDKIKTVWGESLDPSNVLNEYPRPILKRKQWKNLNGLWNFKITSKGEKKPNRYVEKILVPFPIESSLSGVQKRIDKKNHITKLFHMNRIKTTRVIDPTHDLIAIEF